MTDLEKFIELYRGFGIECKVNEDEEGCYYIKLAGDVLYRDGDETESDKFVGYTGFYSAVWFDSNGNFVNQAFEE